MASNSDEALEQTNRFYLDGGFTYTEQQVTEWLRRHITLPRGGRVLDLCCGDGIWSRGFQLLDPDLELYGIDISCGGIAKARGLLGPKAEFVVGDAEQEIPWPQRFFDVIFSRGPGLYNQHDMSRPETVAVIERWHESLAMNGRMYSVFSSRPELMGQYTSPQDVVLPLNKAPRKTATVDFRGGKFHHSIESFHAPFWKAHNVVVVGYSFVGNMHILISARGDASPDVRLSQG